MVPLQVQHSADGGATWLAAPVTLSSSVKVGVTRWVHFQNQGVTYMGLFAAEDGAAAPSAAYFFFIDQNGDPSTLTNWTDDSANIPAAVGTERIDDHFSATRDQNENQYFVIKTEGGNSTDPRLKLFKRTSDGTWAQFTVTEVQESPQQTRPSLVVDAENAELYVFSTDTGGGNGRRVKARLDSLQDLATAARVTLFASGDGPFDNLISPRHTVDSVSDITVLAHNTAADTVWHSFEDIQSPVVVPDVVGLSQADAETAIVNANLTVGNVSSVYNDSVPSGNVIGQDPIGGATSSPGSARRFGCFAWTSASDRTGHRLRYQHHS